jgi:hypothetical protein
MLRAAAKARVDQDGAVTTWAIVSVVAIELLLGHGGSKQRERAPWLRLLSRLLLTFETSTEHSTKSEGMICPVVRWRGWGRYLLNPSAQPKHDADPWPLGCCFLPELFFQA